MLENKLGNKVMDFEKRKYSDILIIKPLGANFELYEIKQFKNHFFKLAENKSIKTVLINLEKIERIDSSGIGIFVSFWKTFGDTVKLKFFNLQPHILKIFHSVNLDKIFEIYENEEEVVELVQEAQY